MWHFLRLLRFDGEISINETGAALGLIRIPIAAAGVTLKELDYTVVHGLIYG